MTEIKRIGIWPPIVVRLSPYLLFIHHSFEPGVRNENRNSVKRSRKSRQTGWLTRSDKLRRSAREKGNMRKRTEKGVAARFWFTWMFTSELNKPLNIDLSSGSVPLFFSHPSFSRSIKNTVIVNCFDLLNHRYRSGKLHDLPDRR